MPKIRKDAAENYKSQHRRWADKLKNLNGIQPVDVVAFIIRGVPLLKKGSERPYFLVQGQNGIDHKVYPPLALFKRLLKTKYIERVLSQDGVNYFAAADMPKLFHFWTVLFEDAKKVDYVPLTRAEAVRRYAENVIDHE